MSRKRPGPLRVNIMAGLLDCGAGMTQETETENSHPSNSEWASAQNDILDNQNYATNLGWGDATGIIVVIRKQWYSKPCSCSRSVPWSQEAWPSCHLLHVNSKISRSLLHTRPHTA